MSVDNNELMKIITILLIFILPLVNLVVLILKIALLYNRFNKLGKIEFDLSNEYAIHLGIPGFIIPIAISITLFIMKLDLYLTIIISTQLVAFSLHSIISTIVNTRVGVFENGVVSDDIYMWNEIHAIEMISENLVIFDKKGKKSLIEVKSRIINVYETILKKISS